MTGSEIETRGAVSTYRVCVVDDDIEASTVLCEGLKLLGYNCAAVHSGGEALELCAQEDFDLVLLDVLLPDIDGYEVLRRLKESPQTRNIVAVFITVKGSAKDIAKGMSLGAADYITKPYNLPIVMVRVDSALREKARVETDSIVDSMYTDVLTGLHNSRSLLERLQEEVRKAHRYNYPVSCVVFDVDDVHAMDDELGPVSLDDLLVEFAMILRDHSRMHDLVARYDGTVFAAILPHTPLQPAIDYARKIMREVDTTTFSDPNFPTEAKLSIGIVACQNGSALGADFVLGEAMRGLLRAKGLAGERLSARNLSEG